MVEKDYKRLNSLDIGETLTRPVFLDKLVDCKTRKGDPYVKFTISDSENSVDANMFCYKQHRSVTVEMLQDDGIKPLNIIQVTISKNEKGFLNVEAVSQNNDPDVVLQDFAHKVEGSSDERYESILSALTSVSEERKYLYCDDSATISDLVIALYRKYEKEIKWSAAAKIMHSEMAGGLLEHTEAMVRSALKVCEVYPDLDKELLVAGAALHDIGKIEELNTNPLGRANYTPQGIGIGHCVLGYTYIDREVQENPGKYPEERVFLLKSLILSHHGKKEYGAPIEPIVIEGYVLFCIDEMDAKYHEMKKATDEIKAGTISDKNALGINHLIYRPEEG